MNFGKVVLEKVNMDENAADMRLINKVSPFSRGRPEELHVTTFVCFFFALHSVIIVLYCLSIVDCYCVSYLDLC